MKKRRALSARTGMALAITATVGLAALVFSQQAKAKSSQLLVSGLTAAGLATQRFNASAIKRILAIEPWVEKYANDEGLDPDLINGIIWIESGFQPRLISSAGARGLMQIMPRTQSGLEKDLGLSHGNPFNQRHNIRLGAHYIHRLLDMWDGDERLALGSYNWGPANVEKNQDKFIDQVESYVEVVQASRQRFARARDSH